MRWYQTLMVVAVVGLGTYAGTVIGYWYDEYEHSLTPPAVIVTTQVIHDPCPLEPPAHPEKREMLFSKQLIDSEMNLR